jgi:hypothetical protein
LNWQPPQPPSGNWPPPHQPWAPAPPTNGKATTALVLGICGVMLFPILLSVPALVLGYQARREIDSSNGASGGRGQAIAGIVLGWVGLVLGVVIVLALIGLLVGSGDGGSSFTVAPRDQVN